MLAVKKTSVKWSGIILWNFSGAFRTEITRALNSRRTCENKINTHYLYANSLCKNRSFLALAANTLLALLL